MNTCIKVKDLTKSFGERVVVDKITFRVEKGEVFGLLGHNGAGKSTIIDLLLGLKKPDCGTSTIFGLEPTANRKAVFERVGVQLQSSNYQNNIRVDELCKEMSALYEKPEDYRRLLQLFSLEKFDWKAPLLHSSRWVFVRRHLWGFLLRLPTIAIRKYSNISSPHPAVLCGF